MQIEVIYVDTFLLFRTKNTTIIQICITNYTNILKIQHAFNIRNIYFSIDSLIIINAK